jgi:pimeloyl-ACP methyl ester carboxylesterase
MNNWVDTVEYPFRPNYFLVNNYRLHYIDEGKGETLLFIHGTPSWSFDFRHLVKDLSRDFRCIAIDHIGFGLSDKPREYDYSTITHSETLKMFIEQRELKNITLVVHDFGGPIALSVAVQKPELFKRIVILNSWLWSSEGDADFIKLKRILKSPLTPLLYKYFNFSARFILPSTFGKKKLSKNILRSYTAPFRKIEERQGPLAFAKSLLNDQAWFGTLWDQRQVLSEKKILLIWGMKDPVVKSKYLDKFIEGFPDARVEKIDSAGHFPQEEEPQLVIRTIKQFLT